jgi:hypothetical protein
MHTHATLFSFKTCNPAKKGRGYQPCRGSGGGRRNEKDECRVNERIRER